MDKKEKFKEFEKAYESCEICFENPGFKINDKNPAYNVILCRKCFLGE